MELGRMSLRDCYLDKQLNPKQMEPEQINKLIIDTLTGLKELHFQKIIHRDIKPDNILLMPDGQFKITDFGVSRTYENHENSITIVGTFWYLPPEIRKYYANGVYKISKEESQNIDWFGFDTYSLGLSILAAVGQIKQMKDIVEKNLTFEKLKQFKEEKKYHHLVYEIIGFMIQEKQEDRPTPEELLLFAEDLEV